MNITYDKEADAAYIRIRAKAVHNSIELEKNVILDLDKEGNVIGIEILQAKHSKVRDLLLADSP